jgi:hypothetical protein
LYSGGRDFWVAWLAGNTICKGSSLHATLPIVLLNLGLSVAHGRKFLVIGDQAVLQDEERKMSAESNSVTTAGKEQNAAAC